MHRLTFPAVLLAALLSLSPFSTLAQTPFSMAVQPEWLKEVMPMAETFSEKEPGEAPVYRAYRKNPDTGAQEHIGFVFMSDDYKPERVGYAAPIDLLVGMDLNGVISNIKVLDYYESYLYSRGDFVNNSVFLSQFRRKPITDGFRVDRDIDGLSSATVTSSAISRTVGESSRRVARAFLGYGVGTEEEQNTTSNALALLEPLTWPAMLDMGIIRTMDAKTAEGVDIQLAFTYIGRRALGEFFLGAEGYNTVESDAAFRAGGGELMLIAPSGPGAGNSYRQFPMSVEQDDIVRRVAGNRFSNAGNASVGAIAGHANYAVAIAMHPDFDITRPFTIIYHTPGGGTDVRTDYSVTGVGLTLARNEPILSEEELLEQRIANAGFFERLMIAPPWGETPWVDVILLSILLGLVLAAFLRKSSATRWTAMTITLFYLGFYKDGFLSVSHITSLLKQGPTVFTSNLTTLMIVSFTLITTLIWGRVFCSSLCPFGALQDFIARFTPKRLQFKMPQAIHDRALYIKYGILALILTLALTNPDISIFQYFEPFGTVFFFSPSTTLWVILIAILIACVLVERFYCRYVCPLGAALGVMSLLSPLRIKRVPQCTLCKVCESACPTGAIRREVIDFKECVRCDVCEIKLIKLAGTCRHPMEEITRRQRDKQTIQVVNVMPPITA
ncbi:MAG: 4Fe-4S binding protein [Gammaproteobacteria bacterium]|nr:4Fe-4S binding protein [Gammaproteobacteria bacterium]MDP2140673.1 4Fe-4S binding protein [Gammaproteobacteria bacterium]MDP2346932.1 4Fe-4S binding protein [Gammaproteobacteria bacterium]